ncbi:hypothetical protein MPER_00263 [Moniliophthora perniciosa FA553]|nr:hypothetical protein MPER_00263 [Moniliophthora perniciosa FA553]
MPAHRSEVAFYHNFTPPPPLSSIGVGSVDVEEEVPVLPSPLELNGLLANINQWRLDQLEGLRLRILTDKKAFAQVSAIERELSRSSSTNIANAREKLESNKWVSLFYVSCNVQAFGTETWEEFSELPPGVAIEPKNILARSG